jgi:transposase
LPAEQKHLIPELLWHGPEAYGFRGEAWTRTRIAKVLEQEFGLRYHKGHIGRLLQELSWTPGEPIRQSLLRADRQRLVYFFPTAHRLAFGHREPTAHRGDRCRS